jgi:hypothetical protein
MRRYAEQVRHCAAQLASAFSVAMLEDISEELRSTHLHMHVPAVPGQQTYAHVCTLCILAGSTCIVERRREHCLTPTHRTGPENPFAPTGSHRQVPGPRQQAAMAQAALLAAAHEGVQASSGQA